MEIPVEVRLLGLAIRRMSVSQLAEGLPCRFTGYRIREEFRYEETLNGIDHLGGRAFLLGRWIRSDRSGSGNITDTGWETGPVWNLDRGSDFRWGIGGSNQRERDYGADEVGP